MRHFLGKWFVVAMCLLVPGVPALAEVLILDRSDADDWVRLLAVNHNKDKDTILRPNALLKFDLADLPARAVINRATLYFYTEASSTQATIALYHVTDDSWSSLGSAPEDLYGWPVSNLLLNYQTGFTGWRSVDVTADLREELLLASPQFSVKWTDPGYAYPPERICSPSTRSGNAPYLKIDYTLITPVAPPPDLTLGPADLRLSDSTPAPDLPAQVTVTVSNIGPTNALNVLVHLYDGDPDAGGAMLGSLTIPTISGGGGQGSATFAWTPRVGMHRLFAVLDPANAIAELDEYNNREFLEVLVLRDYRRFSESFENGAISGNGMVGWTGLERDPNRWAADADLPFLSDRHLARSWYIRETRDQAYDGHNSLYLYLDGRSDDGTIWVERWVPVDPNTKVTVDLSFAFGIHPDMATAAVYYIGVLDPEQEQDFTWVGTGEDGWRVLGGSRTVSTGEATRLWVAVGLTVSWETEVYHYLDQINLTVR